MTSTSPTPLPAARLRRRAGAALYDLLNKRVDRRLFGERRRRLLSGAHGRVLDVGAGTGVNLAYYIPAQISDLVLLDPSDGMLARALRKSDALGIPAAFRLAGAEDLPYPDGSFDTVVFTLALCTIPDPAQALREARRVLQPDGRLLVFEHVRAADPRLARLQDRFAPIQYVTGSGCHPNRDTRRTIEAAGFIFDDVEEWVDRRVPIPWIRSFLQAVAHKAPSRRAEVSYSGDGAAESAVRAQVAQSIAGADATGDFSGRVSVDGHLVEYDAHTLGDGSIDVAAHQVARAIA